MLSHYHTAIDPGGENNSHASMLRMVGFNKRALEVGCASGHVSERLQAQGCRVVGVEVDAAVAEAAMPWLERLVVGDVESDQLWGQLEGEEFDAIIFGDVLEHLREPLRALRSSLKHLRPTGVVVVSVPNITHVDVKVALLRGTFPYAETGLLDRTHVHFITKESLLDMLREAGLVGVELQRVTVPAFSTEIGVERGDLSDEVLEALLADRESLTYQFVVKAVHDDGGRALEELSQDMVGLTDQLVDLNKRHETLTHEYAVLAAQHEWDEREIARLRRQTDAIKRLIPGPLRRRLGKSFSS
jgi:2-polyprenyl-3-methyl-5-hydroxy-6-metoxy-1,4-benzoquinol methylase